MSNRTRNGIIAEMLAAVERPSPKTAMMYGARLSYAQLRHYHGYLAEKGLIVQVDGLWVATEKGRSFSRAYAHAEEILKDGGL